MLCIIANLTKAFRKLFRKSRRALRNLMPTRLFKFSKPVLKRVLKIATSSSFLDRWLPRRFHKWLYDESNRKLLSELFIQIADNNGQLVSASTLAITGQLVGNMIADIAPDLDPAVIRAKIDQIVPNVARTLLAAMPKTAAAFSITWLAPIVAADIVLDSVMFRRTARETVADWFKWLDSGFTSAMNLVLPSGVDAAKLYPKPLRPRGVGNGPYSRWPWYNDLTGTSGIHDRPPTGNDPPRPPPPPPPPNNNNNPPYVTTPSSSTPFTFGSNPFGIPVATRTGLDVVTPINNVYNAVNTSIMRGIMERERNRYPTVDAKQMQRDEYNRTHGFGSTWMGRLFGFGAATTTGMPFQPPTPRVGPFVPFHPHLDTVFLPFVKHETSNAGVGTLAPRVTDITAHTHRDRDVPAGISGRGSYYARGRALSMGNNPPTISNRGSGDITIRHREYVCDINSQAGGTAFNSQLLAINPCNSALFPFASIIANMYENYRCEGLVFEFKSTMLNSTSNANPQSGAVIMATDYNVYNQPYSTKQEMENATGAVSARPTNNMMHFVETAKNKNAVSDVLYCWPGGSVQSAAAQDLRLYNLGNFQVATQGLPTSGVRCGELWVSYQFSFSKPNFAAFDSPQLVKYAHFSAGSAGNTNLFGLTIKVNGAVPGSSPVPGTSSYVSPFTADGWNGIMINQTTSNTASNIPGGVMSGLTIRIPPQGDAFNVFIEGTWSSTTNTAAASTTPTITSLTSPNHTALVFFSPVDGSASSVASAPTAATSTKVATYKWAFTVADPSKFTDFTFTPGAGLPDGAGGTAAVDIRVYSINNLELIPQ